MVISSIIKSQERTGWFGSNLFDDLRTTIKHQMLAAHATSDAPYPDDVSLVGDVFHDDDDYDE